MTPESGRFGRLRALLAAPSARRLARFVLAFEAVALAVAAVLSLAYGIATGTPPLDTFFLVSFLIFLLLLFYAVLSAPGSFARPRLAPLDARGRPSAGGRWLPQRRDPAPVRDLLLYTGLAFLFLILATLVGRILGG